MCLAFLLFTTALHQPEMGRLLDSSYKTAFNNRLSLKGLEKDKLPVLPWESEIKRKLPYKAGSDTSKAFTSGFISGRKEVEIVEKALRQIKTHLKAELSGKYDPKSTYRRLEPELEAIKASMS